MSKEVSALNRQVSNLSKRPGVYRMLDDAGDVLYVGKAKNLKNRVSSYFGDRSLNSKTSALVEKIVSIETTITPSEKEALILENNLIKQYQPRYNILLRDDRSYPYLFMNDQHAFPGLYYYRGSEKKNGQYFGPYPSASSVHYTLNLIQKVFRIRQCDDQYFKHRKRPCLQYQIKRCSAPCVQLISKSAYKNDLKHAVLLLNGKDDLVIAALVDKMEGASAELAFEQAATYRNQIRSLRKIQDQQVMTSDQGDSDFVACEQASGVFCVVVLFVRGGRVLGDKAFFPKSKYQAEPAEILSAFLTQYYLGKFIPRNIVVNQTIADIDCLLAVFRETSGRSVDIKSNVRGDRLKLLKCAIMNAKEHLATFLKNTLTMKNRLNDFQRQLKLENSPTRIECFDISHTQGKETVASCVVFNQEGAHKSFYRKYNIENITPGDDYAAMRQAIYRRYKKMLQGEGELPDILLVDGGKGQVKQAVKALEELALDDIKIVGVAKGEGRKPGLETLILSQGKEILNLPPESAALHLIQQIRDEAHRFAIAGHREKRQKGQLSSTLERIQGIGANRRRLLLSHFGGLQGVTSAGIDDLAKVPGISQNLATRIYDNLH